MTKIMSNLAKITLGGAIAISPALYAQTSTGTSDQTGQPSSSYSQPGNAGTDQTGNMNNTGQTGNVTNPNQNTGNQVNTGQPGQTGTTGTETNPNAAPTNGGTANTGTNQTMPRTASGWLEMLFSGTLLSAAGFALRRRLRRA